MASGVTRISDLVVPAIFAPYVQQLTEQKSLLVQSGALARDGQADANLAGGGLTFNLPSFKDLDNDTDLISSDDNAVLSTPFKIGTATEIGIRLSRNQSWSDMDLDQALAGADPLGAITDRVAGYWARRLQAAFVAEMTGVFADNAAAPTGTDTHLINDMTVDVSGGGYIAGVTDFSAEAFIDAAVTMGDSMDDLTLVLMHSVVYARALKNNLIDFVADAQNPDAIKVPTFLGRKVVRDDSMPVTSGVYQTWLFGAGAVRLGMGSPSVPAETIRVPSAGNGSGQETLHSRVEWLLHPKGHAWIGGTTAKGGPSNAATASNLAHLDSWSRVWPERKQIKIARLITRES